MRTLHIGATVCALTLASPFPSFGDDLHQFDDQAQFKTTREYVRACSAPGVSVDCLTDFTMAQLAISLDKGAAKNCVPDTSAASREKGNTKMVAIITRLVAWLRPHPEYSEKPDSEGLSAAMQAVYPCKS